MLIHSYIDVQVRLLPPKLFALHSWLTAYVHQYNALLDLADNNNSYAINWHGPATAYTAWGQLAALDVLVSAISANT